MALPSPLPLKNPPIIEALLDVQVAFPHPIEAQRLKDLGEVVKSAYPVVKPQFMATIQFQPIPLQAPAKPSIDQGFRGFSFLSEDEKEIVQFRLDGFTFNRLAPYISWEDMYKKAFDAWRHYRAGFPEGRVTRVATKFLNKILIPFDKGRVDLDDYFAVGIKDLDDETLPTVNFMSQQRFLDSVSGYGVDLNLSRFLPEQQLGVILDIEVFTQDPSHLAAAEPFSILATMREIKNSLFLKALTPKGLDLFK
jgi:uncharacterized protein (TIGR04255 family)